MFLQHLNMITESRSSKQQSFSQKIISPVQVKSLRICLSFIRDMFLKFVHCPLKSKFLDLVKLCQNEPISMAIFATSSMQTGYFFSSAAQLVILHQRKDHGIAISQFSNCKLFKQPPHR